jgi:hypothetical protein
MKFSINNLLTKYILVSFIILLFMGAIIINSFSHKESMKLPKEPNYQYYGIASNVSIPPPLHVPQCNLMDKTECSTNSYCKWSIQGNLCNNKNNCSNMGKENCKKSNNCIWSEVSNICFYK